MRRLLPRDILFPNEHGAWAAFFVSFLIGWLAAPVLTLRPLLLLPAAVGAFLARYPIGIYFKKRRVTRQLNIPLIREKRWFIIYSSLTLLVSWPLFWPLGWWELLIFAALSALTLVLHLASMIHRKERSLFVELSAMAGITFLTPAAVFCAELKISVFSLFLWLVVFLFFTFRVLSVRNKIKHRNEKPVDIRQVGRKELLYSLILLVGIVVTCRLSKVTNCDLKNQLLIFSNTF